MFCAKCGATLQESSQFCDRCGAPTAVQPKPASAQVASPIEAGKTSGKALGSLITGIFGLLLFPLANEASAVHSVRQIVSAEATYYLAYPNAGYTCTLSSLAGGERPSPSAAKTRLIDDRLAMGEKYGYRFVVQNCVHPETGEGKYQVVAYPVSRNQTGVRAFCSDETGVIKFDTSGSPDDCLANGERLP